MTNQKQSDPALNFISNLLDNPNYYANNGVQPIDIIDFFLHSSNPLFINKVFSELTKRFLKVETLSLCKLLIIHFFKYTQPSQRMIPPNSDFADHFVNFIPIKRWQTALEFRAVLNLIPSISPVANPLNPKIRSDTLSLIQMINGLESSDPEVFESAKEVLQELGRKISPLQNIYLKCIKMPYLLFFLPDMTSDSNLVHQAIFKYNSLFQSFIQKKLRSETNENTEENSQQLAICPSDDKNRFELFFEHESPNEFLHDILLSIIQFIRNLKVFPRNLFSTFVDLFHFLIPEPGTEGENVQIDRNASRKACVLIFDTFSSIPEYLRPYQIHAISDIAVNFILNVPITNGSTISAPDNEESANNQISIEKSFLKSPLRMLSRLHVTDMRLIPIQPIDIETAALLVSVFPRPNEDNGTNNSTYADQVVKIFLPFQGETFSIGSCRLFLTHLVDFVPYLSEEAHSIIIEVLLPNLMKQGIKHQETIALFLSSISFLSNLDLLPLYLIFCQSFPDGFQIASRLKAASMTLFLLANEQPDEKFTTVSPSEVFDYGKAFFRIGEYKQLAKLCDKICMDPFNYPNDTVASAQAFHDLVVAETYSNSRDHSRAAREFIRAADAFKLTSFPHDFHLFYLNARHFFESICFQVELMSKLTFDGGYGQMRVEPLSADIVDINELLQNLKELKGSSLLLHPQFDEVSLSYVDDFIRTAEEMIASIDKGYEEFLTVISNRKIIPPPVFFETEQPITVEDVRIVNPNIDIKNSTVTRHFFLEMKGRVVYNSNFFNNNDCEEDLEKDDRKIVKGLFNEDQETLILKELRGNDGYELKNNRKSSASDFYFLNRNKIVNGSTFLPICERQGIEWAKNNDMKLICHVSIVSNGVVKKVHTQEIPIDGEFSVDFPVLAEYKEMCSPGLKTDFSHTMSVTFFFTAAFEGPKSSSYYRIGREERHVYIRET